MERVIVSSSSTPKPIGSGRGLGYSRRHLLNAQDKICNLIIVKEMCAGLSTWRAAYIPHNGERVVALRLSFVISYYLSEATQITASLKESRILCGRWRFEVANQLAA
ncbi:hypothetical protein PCH_Pc20g09700 [Penicillium rubens Wisconsin 54-1255]|uniref:Uncharacterized protein n=1 Tax=Penicillium rubens (strain ATCC 28089 / DSM 1075 / NRRL 1951 / Wisconsin 54-1255) TaxID=500485 RepID=B6HFC8_PENRW|nr:hypothetical protein PCH_Pc20g09700 [Penicillium rubens Wisconsin 54-1255]